MTVPFGIKVNLRLIAPSLAVALLLLAGGCKEDDEAPTTTPSSGQRPAPQTSKVENDLRKDLGGPVIKPDATTTTPPPAAKPTQP